MYTSFHSHWTFENRPIRHWRLPAYVDAGVGFRLGSFFVITPGEVEVGYYYVHEMVSWN